VALIYWGLVQDKATELAYEYFEEHKIEPFSEKELRRYRGRVISRWREMKGKTV